MKASDFPKLKRNEFKTLQVNIGYKCNQACTHCHVNAGPHRFEMMKSETIDLIPLVLKMYKVNTLDLTGGAPEIHPEFKYLVKKARDMNINVIDRCNLTILSEPGYEDLADFLAENRVKVIASLPCYEKKNVDEQRGNGVFESSLVGLRKLNKLGYGSSDKKLILDLVFNPQGAKLPPPQASLENEYKNILDKNYQIKFNNLLTITNMPIKRFALQLKATGQLDKYERLLKESHNPTNLDSVMCKNLISVDWQGYLFDCDFNQQLGINIAGKNRHLTDLIQNKRSLKGNNISIGKHCYGCTAGNGSSCGGALAN